MKKVIEIYEENLKKHPEMTVVRSAKHDEGLTYKQIEDISGRVYNYLKSKNIGTDDIVALIVDRDVWFLPLIIAVMKAGAAFILIENITPKERIDFIIKDSGAKLVIDDKDIDKICKYNYIEEYKIADFHDLCFIIYTSGTTGNPKGIMHEYGKWNTITNTSSVPYFKNYIYNKHELYAVSSSLNFAMSLFYIYAVFYLEKNIYIVPYEILKNIKAMEQFLYEKKVATTILTPSYIKEMNNIPKCLDTILVGGEAANNLYIEGPRLINVLTSSETLVTVTCFIIDKLYNNCPLGKILNKKYVYLKDDNGKDVEKGKIGEICIKNEYTRGYVNLKSLNDEVFVDGLCHSGDLAYIDENDNLIFYGRKDSMIKIDGNRVEPLEVENKIKEIIGLNDVVVKGFNNKNRDYLCAYLLKNEMISKNYYNFENNKINNADFINDKLRKVLPEYMLPTYYIIIDDYPRNENGKIQISKLLPPIIEEYKEKYTPPTNEIEKKICIAFSKVLNIKNIGIDDDFFLLGGDSLKTLELLIVLDNIWLNAKDIYENRTVRKLALKYKKHNENVKNIDEENEKLKKEKLPLMDEQIAILNVQAMDLSNTCFNIGVLTLLDNNIDLNKFENAVNKVFMHHPAFNTSIYYDENKSLAQGIKNNINKKVEIIKLTEKEFDEIKDNLIKPFVFEEYINHRKKIFVTEKSTYFFFEIFHTMADGYSIKLILKQIYDCYKNENTVLEPDYYYFAVKQYDDFLKSEEAKVVQEYYKKNYLEKYDFNIDMLGLTPDSMEFSLKLGYIEKEIDLKKHDLLKNKNFLMMGDNIFFMFCCIIAMLRKDRKNTMAMQWLYDGRDSNMKRNSVGLFYKIMPIILVIKPEDTVLDTYNSIKQQVEFEIAYNNYSFNHNNNNILNPCLQFICQKNVKIAKEHNELYKNIGKISSKNDGSDGVIGFEVIDNDDEDDIICCIDYAATIYNKKTIEKFFTIYNDTVNKVYNIEDLSKTKTKELFREIA